MSLNHSPSVVTNGLVMYYDSSNTQKSWRGAPTTNLIYSTPLALGVYAYATGPVPIIAVDANSNVITVNRYTISQAVNVGRAAIFPPTGSLVLGTPYAFSCIWKYNGFNTSTPSLIIDAGKGNPETGGANTFSKFVQTNTPLLNGWTYSKLEFILATSPTLGTYLTYGIATGADTTYINNTFDVYCEQFEQNLFATPFVSGSRLTTQSIVDLTNNNTITATNLTYATDGTFSFNGSSNYIDATGAVFSSTMNAYTVMHWSRRDAENRMPIGYRAGPSFYHYGDNSWAYTHGGVVGEYYYPHAVSIPAGTYGFYCIVYNGANISIYRNGVFEGSQATTGIADWSNGMRIGYWNGGPGYYYQGKIDAVSFYNRALSAAEVSQNFNALRGRYGI